MDSQREIQRVLNQEFDHSRFVAPVAVTFTMKQWVDGEVLDESKCSKNLTYFFKKFNQEVFGNAAYRFGKKVECFSVLENSANNLLHFHCVIDNFRKWSPLKFKYKVKHCWESTRFGNREINIQHDSNSGWVSYITKLKTKENLADSIDWNNSSW